MNAPNKTICFFNSNRAWGGGEKWHFTTAQEFQRRGYKTMLITNVRSELANKGIKERLDVYRYRVSSLSFLNPIKILVLAALFKFQKVDAVILNLPQDLKLAGIAAKLAGVKKIIYRRGMPHPLRNTWLNRFLFTKILTNVVVNSKEIGRSLKQGNESWFPEEKMVLIYNGVDTSKPIDKSRKLYEKQGDEIVIGNAGRLTEQKGQKYLVELGKLLKADGVKFKILIAGEGELRQSLLTLINNTGLSDHIKLLGHVDDMSAFFNSLDIFVFTSLYEGSANTLIETLQHKVVSIAWDVSSNPEIIEHGVSGFLAKSNDVADLFKTTDFATKNLAVSNQIRLNGLSKLEEKFDNLKNLKLLENLF